MASPDEVRTTSATGGQKGMKQARFDLIPIEALTELAKHYGRGAEKYDDNQWRKGYEWSKSYAALQRHITAFWNGEDIDPDPEMQGAPHLAAAAWHIFTLLTFQKDFPEFDDRYKAPEDADLEEDRVDFGGLSIAKSFLPLAEHAAKMHGFDFSNDLPDEYFPADDELLMANPFKVGDTVSVYNTYIDGPAGPAAFKLVVRDA